MANNEEDITRNHEVYVRHISLFGKAVPIALKALIKKIEAKHGKSLGTILEDKKDTIKIFYYDLFQALFKDDEKSVNTEVESWGLSTLCGVISFVLSESSELDCVNCISDQLRYIEKYSYSASLEYNAYKQKQESLCESLLELVKESEDHFKCKQLIYSYGEPKEINVSKEFMKELKHTRDVDKHIHVALSCNFATDGHSETDDVSSKRERSQLEYSDLEDQITQFFQPLSDIVVHEEESVVLSCELNTAESHTEWQKNDEPLLETNTVKVFAGKGYHWLVFAKAISEDTGKYSCVCKNVSTSAFVKVSKQDFKVVEALHKDVDGEVKENMDVSLVCTVNEQTTNPQWFHNNKEVEITSRVVTFSQGLVHKLSIRNVQFEDEGLYVITFDRVTSWTSIEVKGEADVLVKQQLSEKLFTNWIKGVLGLKYLKLGLEDAAEDVVKIHHSEIIKTLPSIATSCKECKVENLHSIHKDKTQSKRKGNKNIYKCPNGGYCSSFFDQIVSDHRFGHPELENTQPRQWRFDQWSVATCYINTKGYKGMGSSKEIDCAGLLSLFINNRRYLPDVNNGAFEMARITRNAILHNSNYELSESHLHESLHTFKDVLEVRNNANEVLLANEESVKKALKAIDKLKGCQIDILTSEDIRTMQDHAMKEDTDIFKEVQKKRDQENQHLEEKLKKMKEELQVIRLLRSTFERDSRLKNQKVESFELILRLSIRVMTPLGGSASEVIQRVYEFIRYEVAENRNLRENLPQPGVHTCKKTFKSVQQILGKILISQNTRVGVQQKGSDVIVQIQCISMKELDERLTTFNGIHFQEAVTDLRKSLDIDDDYQRKYDVTTCCSSQNLKTITKQLCNLRSFGYIF